MPKKFNTIILVLIAMFSQITLAANTQTANPNFFSTLGSSFVTTLSVGPSWESAGQNQILNLTPDIEKNYTADRPANTLATGELFLGIQKVLPESLQAQIGLAFAASSPANLAGDIWDDADPQFDNYTYQYKIQHMHVALKGKLLGDWGWGIFPWVSVSAGIGFNRSYDFSNTPTIEEAITTPNFAAHTMTSFTYTLGIGIQRSVAKNWQIGAGYEFADWGKSELGTSQGQTTNQVLSLPHLYTNSLLVNLTYVA